MDSETGYDATDFRPVEYRNQTNQYRHFDCWAAPSALNLFVFSTHRPRLFEVLVLSSNAICQCLQETWIKYKLSVWEVLYRVSTVIEPGRDLTSNILPFFFRFIVRWHTETHQSWGQTNRKHCKFVYFLHYLRMIAGIKKCLFWTSETYSCQEQSCATD